nr:Imm26 family immunity protein [Melittangium boletus]
MLKLPHDAYYDYRTNTPDSDLEQIASKPILFKMAVRHTEKRAWELIGWRALEEHFSQPIVQFMQDRANFRDCTIFDTVGNERSAEPQDMGRSNASVERLKVRLK